MFREKPVLVSALKAASEAVSEAVNVFSGCMDHNPYPVTTQEAYPVPVTKNPYPVSRIAFLGIPMPRIPYPYYKVSAEPLGLRCFLILRKWRSWNFSTCI